MKNYINKKLIDLPRKFRIWWGSVFIYMLGKIGTNEFNYDIVLYDELRRWLDNNKNPKP